MPERCQDISTSLHTFWHKVPTVSSHEYLQSWFVRTTLRSVLFWMQKKKKKRKGEISRNVTADVLVVHPPGLFCGCKGWLLKVELMELMVISTFCQFSSSCLWQNGVGYVQSHCPVCLRARRETPFSTILCLHELFLKCCVFNLMLRVTNYLKTGTVFVRWMRLNSLQMWTLWFFYDNSLKCPQNKRVK